MTRRRLCTCMEARLATLLASLLAALFVAALPASRGPDRGSRRPLAGDLFVANLRTSDVAWFDGTTGAYLGVFVESGSGGLTGATGVAFGPDGHLYVGSSGNHRVLRYDGATGAFSGVFVDGGELAGPYSLAFGPGGDLYVSSGPRHRVLRYDGGTGELRGVAAEGAGLGQPIGLAFGPVDSLLYVVNSLGRNVLRFDAETGEPRGVFATDSLRFPSDLAFGADRDLYVTSAASSSVVRFDGQTGAFLETRVRLPGRGGAPVGLAFLTDGSMAVGDFGRSRLYLVDPRGGEARLAATRGLAGPENIAVKPAEAGGGAARGGSRRGQAQGTPVHGSVPIGCARVITAGAGSIRCARTAR